MVTRSRAGALALRVLVWTGFALLFAIVTACSLALVFVAILSVPV